MPEEAPAHLFGWISCCHGYINDRHRLSTSCSQLWRSLFVFDLENCLPTKGKEEFHPLKMSRTYINPPVPFKINVNLMEKKKFVIKGTPLVGAKRFTFNFQKGLHSDAPNIAFHFDVRYEDRVIVMNYRRDGKWGPEIRPSVFPFCENKPFILEFLVDCKMYTVDVNCVKVAEFQHQLPMQCVDAFTIEGDVCLSEVDVM